MIANRSLNKENEKKIMRKLLYVREWVWCKSPKKNQGGSTKGKRKPTLVEIYSESFMSEGNSNQAKTKYTFVRFTYLALN